MDKTWEAKLIKHNNINRIAVYFAKDSEFVIAIKTIKGARWSNSLKVWHLPDTAENRIKFKLPAKIIGKQNIFKIDQNNQKAYRAFIDMLI